MMDTAQENIMSNVATMPPRVNGILETSLYGSTVPGRELHPLKSSAFHGALLRQLPSD